MSPLRRIDSEDNNDRWAKPREECRDREHNPPGMIVLPNGTYEHECPSCKKKQRFVVRRPTW